MSGDTGSSRTSKDRPVEERGRRPASNAPAGAGGDERRVGPPTVQKRADEPRGDLPGSAGDAAAANDAPAGTLLAAGDREQMARRWQDIQATFVDQPQQAVQEADALVAELIQHLVQGFAAERRQLKAQLSRGDQVSTEDLRVSLQRYRSFFRRLLSW